MLTGITDITKREDGSYVCKRNGMPYHVPNEGKYVELFSALVDYETQNPSSVSEESTSLSLEQYERAIQSSLETFVRTKGYDSVISCCSYSSSTDATFAAEAAYCIQLRDTTWRQFYTMWAQIEAGARTAPTLDALLAELPISSATWPTSNS